ncbi:hypothetical protein Aperf_G00000129004 [Anoplocephala perfoliata]
MSHQLGTPGTPESFVVNITWPKGYPFTPPIIDLNEFCNRNMPRSLCKSMIDELNEIASQNMGEPLTFTLIEHLRDHFETYAQQIKDAKKGTKEQAPELAMSGNAKTKNDKSQVDITLTKAQKRKQFDRLGADGNLPRGWNWVDVIKHLRQTGTQNNSTV